MLAIASNITLPTNCIDPCCGLRGAFVHCILGTKSFLIPLLRGGLFIDGANLYATARSRFDIDTSVARAFRTRYHCAGALLHGPCEDQRIVYQPL